MLASSFPRAVTTVPTISRGTPRLALTAIKRAVPAKIFDVNEPYIGRYRNGSSADRTIKCNYPFWTVLTFLGWPAGNVAADFRDCLLAFCGSWPAWGRGRRCNLWTLRR
jgi:hypothetical protein